MLLQKGYWEKLSSCRRIPVSTNSALYTAVCVCVCVCRVEGEEERGDETVILPPRAAYQCCVGRTQSIDHCLHPLDKK